MRCGSFRANLLQVFHQFTGLGSPSSFSLQNSKVECDVPSERSVMYPPSGVRCTLRTECDTPSERREAFPSGGGRYSLRAMANRLRFLHRFIGLGSPSSFALQNSLVWSLFFRTVYGFFIGLSVLVRPEFCVVKLAG